LHNIADLYALKEEALLPLERMGKTLAKKLVNQVQSRRQMHLSTFLTALGISEVGPTVADILVGRFDTIEKLQTASFEELSKLHGIGPSIATSLIEGLHEMRHEISKLLEYIELIEHAKMQVDESHILFDKSVVFTGKMATLERKKAQEAVRTKGGHTPSSITHTTDYLVVGDDGSALLGAGQKSTKQKEAEKLVKNGGQIKIITETDFLKMLS